MKIVMRGYVEGVASLSEATGLCCGPPSWVVARLLWLLLAPKPDLSVAAGAVEQVGARRLLDSLCGNPALLIDALREALEVLPSASVDTVMEAYRESGIADLLQRGVSVTICDDSLEACPFRLTVEKDDIDVNVDAETLIDYTHVTSVDCKGDETRVTLRVGDEPLVVMLRRDMSETDVYAHVLTLAYDVLPSIILNGFSLLMDIVYAPAGRASLAKLAPSLLGVALNEISPVFMLSGIVERRFLYELYSTTVNNAMYTSARMLAEKLGFTIRKLEGEPIGTFNDTTVRVSRAPAGVAEVLALAKIVARLSESHGLIIEEPGEGLDWSTRHRLIDALLNAVRGVTRFNLLVFFEQLAKASFHNVLIATQEADMLRIKESR